MFVIDACIAAKWFLPEPLSDDADAIPLEDAVRIAPEHLLVEVGNTLLRAHRSHGITLDHARAAITALNRLVHLRPIHEVADAALTIAGLVGCTNYDALYVAAAKRRDAVLITADAQLVHQLDAAQWRGCMRRLETLITRLRRSKRDTRECRAGARPCAR